MWIYGTAGLMGFLAQIVTGMQGRIVPLYAWYRAFAGSIFASWSLGVPLLAWGLPAGHHVAIRLAALWLLGGVVLGGAYLGDMLRRAAR